MPRSDDLRLTSRLQTATPCPVSFPQYQERDRVLAQGTHNRHRLKGAEMTGSESYPACASNPGARPKTKTLIPAASPWRHLALQQAALAGRPKTSAAFACRALLACALHFSVMRK